MKTVLEGARCEYCDNQAKNNTRLCRPCVVRNGRPGFVPKEGVQVQESRGCTFDQKGNPVPTMFKLVVTA